MRIYIAVTGLIMLLVLFPVAELTRCIVEYNIMPLLAEQRGDIILNWSTGSIGRLDSGWIPGLDNLYAELAFIWGGYFLIPFVLAAAFKLAWLEGRNEGRNE